ncbi:Sulfite oxidase and related enzymes [hydrothermal vent metagenome]|uniref:Sulfite oxidase and related enzymes n=1 Tax=hydrothermal vent metagenome TaxID=652676 RepID=A0A3B0UV41_9ZZZZ
MARLDRLPPGQRLREDWPILHYGEVQDTVLPEWRFRITGLVDQKKELTHDEFSALPRTEVLSDIHCVTGWSKFDNLWEGVGTQVIKDLVKITGDARFVIIHAAGGFTTNLPIDEFFKEDCLFASRHNGEIMDIEHGYPLRLVVPALYFWKSAKWVTGVEFIAKNAPGFWERNGYHNHGDPWKEERYSR